MLIELAMGNLSFKIVDALPNSIEAHFNHLALRLQTEISEAENVNPYFEYKGIVQGIIIINSNNIIKGFNPSFATRLDYNPTEIMGVDINKIVSPRSTLFSCRMQLQDAMDRPIVQTILFVSADKKLVPCSCLLSSVFGTTDYILTTIAINVNERIFLPDKTDWVNLEVGEKDFAVNLHNYILENLGKSLPNIKQLCRIIGTNEFTLKDSFKKKYNSSIYQFYNDERLKRAHLMIQQTDLALKEIAYNSGFNDYVNFSKAFKKKYNYTPGQLYRKNDK